MPRFIAVGGNTSCVEMQAGPDTFILDAGTAIRALGADLVRRKAQRLTLLLSHTHWDHIYWLPFFAPAFDPLFALTIAEGTFLSKASYAPP